MVDKVATIRVVADDDFAKRVLDAPWIKTSKGDMISIRQLGEMYDKRCDQLTRTLSITMRLIEKHPELVEEEEVADLHLLVRDLR